jgi:hypothetical protein
MTVTTLAMLSASVPAIQAHDGGWSTAGKVLTGVGAGLILSHAFDPVPVYTAAPVYVSPAPVVVQQPAQQVVVQQTAPVQSQPLVVQQPTVVYQSAPVVYAPAPVVYPAPVYVRPYYAPVVSFRFGFGGPYYHHHHH